MASITTRITSGLGATVKNSPLSNTEIDTNFISLNTFKAEQTGAQNSIVVPSGSTAARDASPTAGYFRFNATLGEFEGYNGTAWGSIGGGTAINITNDTSTNVLQYPAMSRETSGELETTYVSDAKLYFNPSTGALSSVDFNSFSDVSLKDNIHSIDHATDTILRLNGVSFDWKDTGKTSFGLIAQEVESVLPEIVDNSGEYKTVNYIALIAVLINCVKEMDSRIKELENK